MDKRTAVSLLGGSRKAAAEAIGITQQAISGWREPLSAKIQDRIWAAKARLDAKALADAKVAQDVHA